MKKSKQFLIWGFVLLISISIPVSAKQNDLNSTAWYNNIQTIIKVGTSRHNIGFDTPAAHSVLKWDTKTMDIGVDLKYTLRNQHFFLLEYTHSKVNGGGVYR